ncbi:magnesium transporter CorA family protein [Flexivirga sp. ID2601S]|uniref:Magnesium transporter CorA family protein n=1 Tax=Flexivirga aerilata TaxID=1656889 RepID=A0A849AC85_9MICO|nr:magnesium transporter CorA family protein [Flexivirga aerilata]
MTCQVQTKVWRGGALAESGLPLDRVSELLEEPDAFTWVDLLDPEGDDLRRLADEIGLDPHTVEDALTRNERPKAVRFKSYFFITAFTVTGMAEDDHVHRISIIVLPHGLVTVRLGGAFPVDEVVQNLEDDSDLMQLGPKALLHGLLDAIVDGYFDAISTIDDKVDALESGLFDENHAGKDVARKAFLLHKDVGRLRRIVLPMREVVGVVLRKVTTTPGEQALTPYYEDLYDHTMRVAEWSDSLRDTVESIQDTNLALGDAALNNIMKKLTAWAAIIAVPTAITGFYGQNVPYPGFSKEWGFVVSISLIIVISGALFVSFKRRNWL